jgi:hypothetical protein
MLDKRVITRSNLQHFGEIVDASHVVVRSGSGPRRIVIHRISGQHNREKWVVCCELLATGLGKDRATCAFSHVAFADADHCDSFEDARSRFRIRLSTL